MSFQIQQLQDTSPLAQILGGFGQGVGAAIPQGIDNSILNNILSSQDFQKDPQAYIQSILGANISPASKTAALSGANQMQRTQDSQQKEIKSSLTLNERLNRVETNANTRIKDLIRPFEKSDAFGNIMIDFDNDEEKRVKVLKDIENIRQKGADVTANLYKKAGEEVPQDVIDKIEGADVFFSDSEGKQVSLQNLNRIKRFSKEFSPSKYAKGTIATDPNSGIQFRNNGKEWILIEQR